MSASHLYYKQGTCLGFTFAFCLFPEFPKSLQSAKLDPPPFSCGFVIAGCDKALGRDPAWNTGHAKSQIPQPAGLHPPPEPHSPGEPSGELFIKKQLVFSSFAAFELKNRGEPDVSGDKMSQVS